LATYTIIFIAPLILISPSIVIVASVIFDRFLASDFNAVARMFGVPHFFLLERVYGWTGRAVFYGSPILFLYNIAVYLLLARRLNQDKSWIETVMMVIVILASFLLFLAIVFLILDMRGGDIMPVPEP
jgi:hypothetical protein